MSRMLVIGADAAGMSAASQALRAAASAGRDLTVRVLEATSHTSYSACGLPYLVAGDVDDPGQLVARTAEEHRAAGIDLRLGTRAVAVDLASRTVTAHGPQGVEEFGYDELVLATGAEPVVPAWARDADGGLLPGIAPVKTLDDAAWWLDRMPTSGADHVPGPVAVLGGGYIGVEMVEAALYRGREVHLLTRSRVMSGFEPELSTMVEDGMRAAGVEVVLGAEVTGLRRDGDEWVLTHTAGETRCALVVLALGVRPRTELVADQLPAELVGRSGGLRPDRHGHVVEGLWAAGDCVEVRHRVTGDWAFLPLGTHANKHGRALGDTLGAKAGRLGFDGALGTAITRFKAPGPDGVHLEIARTGTSTAQATRLGLDVLGLSTSGSTASGYMPEAEPITAHVVAERGTRRLLGVEVVGGPGAGKRVDAAAAVLWAGGTVDDLAWMDLAYAPPVATAWEFLQVAARRVAERL